MRIATKEYGIWNMEYGILGTKKDQHLRSVETLGLSGHGDPNRIIPKSAGKGKTRPNTKRGKKHER